jgi:hypothetical protein
MLLQKPGILDPLRGGVYAALAVGPVRSAVLTLATTPLRPHEEATRTKRDL